MGAWSHASEASLATSGYVRHLHVPNLHGWPEGAGAWDPDEPGRWRVRALLPPVASRWCSACSCARIRSAPAPGAAPLLPAAPPLEGFFTGGESAEEQLTKLRNTLSDWDERTDVDFFRHLVRVANDPREGFTQTVNMAGKGLYLHRSRPPSRSTARGHP